MAEPLLATGVAGDNPVASYFEVHVRRGDRWVIDCTTLSAADALAEAEDIARKVDVLGIKVVNERYNPRTDQSAARVIYKLDKPERKRPTGFVRVMAAPRAAATLSVPPPLPELEAAPAPTAAASAILPPKAVLDGGSSPAPWLLFAWASLALALAASLLFAFLLVIA